MYSSLCFSLKKDDKDITQSPVYKMIHGLDEPRRQHHVGMNVEGRNAANVTCHGPRGMAENSAAAAGRASRKHGVSFRVLQWLTETEDDDTDDSLDVNHKSICEGTRWANL